MADRHDALELGRDPGDQSGRGVRHIYSEPLVRKHGVDLARRNDHPVLPRASDDLIAEGGADLADPALLGDLLQRVETQFGRDRRSEPAHGPRTLDLDLLFYGDQEIAEPGLIVPHPRLEDRRFVLEPMSHLMPERVLPRSGRTVRERLLELQRASPVQKGR